MPEKIVYLVPGFFGFTSLGSFNYFYRVADTLAQALMSRQSRFEIIECRTLPTASIRFRADRLLQQVVETGGLDADEIHFIGHSTGGLDMRLLLTPGVRIRQGTEESEIGKKTKSVLTISTPHYGTPLAGFFTTIQGRHLLRILALAATTTGPRYLLFLAAQTAGLVARLDDMVGRKDTFLDFISKRLLRSLTPGREDPVWEFLKQISEDQGAIIQLTPEAMSLFNASVIDHPDIQYNCLLTAAPPPPSGYWLEHLGSPATITLATIFMVMYNIVARAPKAYLYPDPDAKVEALLADTYTFPVDRSNNDGVVPTLSQVHGKVVDAFVADHLDVVGQFRNAGEERHADWLPSGARFDEKRFLRAWDTIAESIVNTGAIRSV